MVGWSWFSKGLSGMGLAKFVRIFLLVLGQTSVLLLALCLIGVLVFLWLNALDLHFCLVSSVCACENKFVGRERQQEVRTSWE